ncbi:MAG: recombinase family protein [Dehalococcoidia bacterium]
MKVALYARVSSVAQDTDLSIGAQLSALRRHAGEHGHDVVAEYIDEAESGRTTNRPEFQRMIAEARNKSAPFQGLLIWKFSRFARSREDSILYKSLLRKHGVRVLSINEPVEESPAGMLVEGIIESVDEFYSMNLAQDVTRGMREAASRGYWVSSQTPYGYRRVRVQEGSKERTRLEVDTATSGVVERIFAESISGIGTKEIAVRLNKDGVPSPAGKRWGRSRVHSMVTNPVYKGTLIFGARGRFHLNAGMEPVRVEGAFLAIIAPQNFDALQARLKSRAPAVQHPRRAASAYVLSGLLYCGDCGARMVGKAAKSGRYHYYVCGTSDRAGSSGCAAKPVSRRKIEVAVLQRILNVVLNEPNLGRLIELTNEEMRREAGSARATVAATEERLADVRKRLDRLYEAIETGHVGLEDLAPRVRALRESERELLAGIAVAQEKAGGSRAALVNRKQVLTYLRDLRALLSAGTPGQRREFLRSFVKRMETAGKTVTIEYALPLPPDKTG